MCMVDASTRIGARQSSPASRRVSGAARDPSARTATGKPSGREGNPANRARFSPGSSTAGFWAGPRVRTASGGFNANSFPARGEGSETTQTMFLSIRGGSEASCKSR